MAETQPQDSSHQGIEVANPHFSGPRGIRVTTNLNCGIQTLMPGETARVNRHTANALRFRSGGRWQHDGGRRQAVPDDARRSDRDAGHGAAQPHP